MKTIEYYLMRHAAYYDNENQYVTYRGMTTLKQSVDKLKIELDEKFPGRKLRVVHSTLPRAKHTSLLIWEMLSGISVLRTSDPSLNSDKLQINDAYVNKVVASCEKENEVCLILSHQPDIEFFCNKELSNSEFIVKVATIEEESSSRKSDSSGDDDDDLPF